MIELLAALMLAGFTLLGGALLLDQIRDSQRRITGDATYAARSGNAERALSAILLNAIPSIDTARRLRGDSASVTLWSFCDVVRGWTEPCEITLVIDRRGDTALVVGLLPGGVSIPLRRERSLMRFRYYDGSLGDTIWRSDWTSNLRLPAALAVDMGTDTIVYPIGIRDE